METKNQSLFAENQNALYVRPLWGRMFVAVVTSTNMGLRRSPTTCETNPKTIKAGNQKGLKELKKII